MLRLELINISKRGPVKNELCEYTLVCTLFSILGVES